METPSVTLSAIEAYLESRRRPLSFPPDIEAIYDGQMRSYRRKVMAKNVWQAIVIYNVFLLADLFLLPGTFVLAAAIHLILVTPIFLLAGVVYRKVARQRVGEVAIAAIPMLMLAQIMFIYALNEGEAADHYQYLAIPVVVYMNMNLRFGFRTALTATLLLVASYLAVLLTGHSHFVAKFVGTSMMISAAYMSLMAARRMEQDVRFAFLTRLRDQLRRENAEDAAQRDALTGLANRRRLDGHVSEIWGNGAEEDRLAAVIMIDIDHFKRYNDRYGHADGDGCLKRVAASVAAEITEGSGLAVRLGGEEFLVLLAGAGMSDAVRFAERVRRRIRSCAIPHEALGPDGIVTVSVGAAAGPVSAHTFAELLSAADAALYAAKRNGRNQVWPPFVNRGNPVVSLLDEMNENGGHATAAIRGGRRTRSVS